MLIILYLHSLDVKKKRTTVIFQELQEIFRNLPIFLMIKTRD